MPPSDGHLETVTASGNTVTFTHDAAGELGRLARSAEAFTEMTYDGRGFLASAAGEVPPALAVEAATRGTPGSLIFADGFEGGDVCAWTQVVGAVPAPSCPKPQQVTAHATYDSSGRLARLSHENPAEGAEDITIFYFGSRLVALRELVNEVETWKWITTDHLGAPIAVTSSTGTPLWRGGFEPYGKDFAGASAAGMFLRLPGQWTDAAWETSGEGAGVYYNVARWYENRTGRYERPDPLGGPARDPRTSEFPRQDTERFSYFSYVDGNPLAFSDPLGLFKIKGCSKERETQINESTAEFCSKLDDPSFAKCCGAKTLPKDLKKLCGDTSLTVVCKRDTTGRCSAPPGKITCGWAIPFGSTIRLCPLAWDRGCGPIGCTMLHEVTHIAGHPRGPASSAASRQERRYSKLRVAIAGAQVSDARGRWQPSLQPPRDPASSVVA